MNEPMSTPRVLYEHRQTGWVMLAMACVPLLCLGTIWATTPPARQALPPALLPGIGIVTAVVLFGFKSLSVMVTRDDLIARFGIGLFRRTVALSEVVAVAVARTTGYQGWGIHRTRNGMHYNVAGFDAVRLELANGRRPMIGSDDASRLAATIRRAIDDRGRSRTAS